MQNYAKDDRRICDRKTFEYLISHPPISQAGKRSLRGLKDDLEGDKFQFLREIKRHFGTKIEICVTGGAVRDAVMGVEPKDVDLLLSFSNSGFSSHREAQEKFEAFFGERECKKTASGEDKLDEWHIYSKKWGKLILAGEKFGVYKLHLKGFDEVIDIAFPRTETATAGEDRGGRDSFDVQSDALLPIEKDLARRDFTFNSMCLVVDYGIESRNASPPSAVISFIDLFSGLADCLEKKTIRTTSDPLVTFGDDLSRIFRAVRLSCKLGFDVDDIAWKAICALASRINKKGTNGNFILKRETLSAELIKSFNLDPLKAFDLLMRPLPGPDTAAAAGFSFSADIGSSCLLEIVFPDLFNEIRFHGRDKSFIHPKRREWYEKTFGTAEPPDEELAESRAVKLKALSRAREMFRLAENNGVRLSPPEIIAILFHDCGETKKLEEFQKKKNRCIYPYGHILSAMIWNRSYSNLKMASLPPGNEKYAIDKNEVARIINGIYTMYTFLDDSFDKKNISMYEVKIKNLASITNILTKGPNDGLLKIFVLDVNATDTVTNTARNRALNLLEFAAGWFESIEKIETEAGRVSGIGFATVFSTKIISDIFMIKEGSAYAELENIAYAAYVRYVHGIVKRRMSHAGDGFADAGRGEPEISAASVLPGFDAVEARKKIFYELILHSTLRKEWERLLTPELHSRFALLRSPEKTAGQACDLSAAEDARREFLYVLERSAYYKYVGLAYLGRPLKAARPNQMKPAAPAKKRGAAFTEKFIAMMHENPVELMEIIERHSRRACERKKNGVGFFDIITPGLASMIGVGQPAKYHSEGDVWEHTKRCALRSVEIRAERNLNRHDYAALAAAVLFHDSGKPAARSIGGKGQICFYGHEELSVKEFAAFADTFSGYDGDAAAVFVANYPRVSRAIKDHSAAAQKISALKDSSRAAIAGLIDIFPDGSADISYYLYLCDSAATISEAGISKAGECFAQISVLEKILSVIDRYNEKGAGLGGLLKEEGLCLMSKDKSSKIENLSLLDAYVDFLDTPCRRGFSAENTAAFIRWAAGKKEHREFAARYIQKKTSLSDLAFEYLTKSDKFKGEPEKSVRSQARKLASAFIQDFDLSLCLKEEEGEVPLNAGRASASFMQWLSAGGGNI